MTDKQLDNIDEIGKLLVRIDELIDFVPYSLRKKLSNLIWQAETEHRRLKNEINNAEERIDRIC